MVSCEIISHVQLLTLHCPYEFTLVTQLNVCYVLSMVIELIPINEPEGPLYRDAL